MGDKELTATEVYEDLLQKIGIAVDKKIENKSKCLGAGSSSDMLGNDINTIGNNIILDNPAWIKPTLEASTYKDNAVYIFTYVREADITVGQPIKFKLLKYPEIKMMMSGDEVVGGMMKNGVSYIVKINKDDPANLYANVLVLSKSDPIIAQSVVDTILTEVLAG